MKSIFGKVLLASFLLFGTVGSVYARECTACKKTNIKKTSVRTKAAECKRAQSTAELNVNNVRALINGYGNMWYDGSLARYNIPKNGTSTPLFCAALWIGGTDKNNQLRIAALRFGSSGDDYWPGPLTIDGHADVTREVCNYYDRHYKISQVEVEAFRSMFDETPSGLQQNSKYDESQIAQNIKEWPAHGKFENQSYYLAPFCDVDGDGEYHFENGDYPYYDFKNELCPRQLKAALSPGELYEPKKTMEDSAGIVHGGLLSDQVLKGDQTIWWVFNDMGNVHTETGGQSIGLEIRAQAFAFSTNDEINNMSFYSYEIINRSTYELTNTYFSQWVDPDLGYAFDDRVGCDVKRGLGYCYNGKDIDGPGTGSYSGIPPAVGIDFFQGPYMDKDGLDNPKIDIAKMQLYYPEALQNYLLEDGTYNIIALTDDADLYYPEAWYIERGDSIGNCAINGVNFGNGIVDDERFGMRRFVYYNNSTNNINGEPSKATDYYNYLQGYWKNGQRMRYGGNAISGDKVTSLECDFMFPGDSDPLHWGTNTITPEQNAMDWTESVADLDPGDRRFMQSAGPFTLEPGALNYITVGIPFAQASSGNAWSSVLLLREIDDVCQALFENCFSVLNGPDAPTLVVQELSNEVILYITYENPNSNNAREHYSELDVSIVPYYYDAQGIRKAYTPEQRSYKFEGYQIYQLVDEHASIADIGDETKARLVAQCDVENYSDSAQTVPVGRLVNYTLNSTTQLLTPKIMVDGANTGIKHVFRVTEDQFADGINTKLVNNKEYYYICVAYAYNCFKEYSQTDPSKLDGQKEPYLAGRKNEHGGTIEPVKAMPHDPSVENGGTLAQATYGLRPNITRIEGYGNGGTVLSLTQKSIEELMGKRGEPGKGPGTFVERTAGSYRATMQNPCIIAHPRYEQNAGPIDVRIIDPLNVKPGQFYVRFDNATDSSRWVISRVDGTPLFDTVYTDTADFTIDRYNEQLFLDLGISVAIKNPKPSSSEITLLGISSNYRPSLNSGIISENAVLGSSMVFSDQSRMWLSAIPDNDSYESYNWIRSGSQFAQANEANFLNGTTEVASNEPFLDEDYYRWELVGQRTETSPIDKYESFENVLFGMWAPYGLTSARDYHPAFSLHYYLADSTVIDSIRSISALNARNYSTYFSWKRRLMASSLNWSLAYNDFSKLPSVRIVITNDTSKWTRCPVLEMCDDYTQSEGHARRFQMCKHKSVDKNGDTLVAGATVNIEDPSSPAYICEYGMGWFPGYAISLETGERLNIMFGEDSRYIQYNGRDMMWNPVSTIMDGSQNYVMGGRHFIYVMNAMSQKFPRYHGGVSSTFVTSDYATPSYDAGRWSARMLQSLDHMLTKKDDAHSNGLLPIAHTVLSDRDSSMFLFSSVAWVNMPIVQSRYAFSNPKDIPCDVTINLNVNSPYGQYFSSNQTGSGDSVRNNNMPMYMFELTDDVITLTGLATADNAPQSEKDSILARINVVPNPYYSASDYETKSQLDTRVRFVNVPANSTISIYTLDGTLVRRFGPTPSNTTTYDWDLLNHTGLPISGGVYLVHFKVPNVGERVVKWFGTMRAVDFNSFKF